MAKTIDQWQAEIIAAKEADPVIGTGGPSELSSTSTVSIWRLWTRIVATAMADLGQLFDFHKGEVAVKIANDKPHRLNWYVGKALAYQHGDSLPDDSDVYDPVKEESDAARVVKFAAATETSTEVRIKAAKGTAGSREALSGPELTGWGAYMFRIKDAGVRIRCTSGDPDNLQMAVNVYYDPLVLNAAGERLDGTATTPVKDAMNSFLGSLPFNGLMEYNKLVAAGQAVEGVKVFEPLVCQGNYGASPYVNIIAATPNVYSPDAGYLELDDTYFDANVNYIAMP